MEFQSRGQMQSSSLANIRAISKTIRDFSLVNEFGDHLFWPTLHLIVSLTLVLQISIIARLGEAWKSKLDWGSNDSWLKQ